MNAIAFGRKPVVLWVWEEHMAVHLYLSTIPEALIASMLTPMDFGAYYAVGMEKKSRGQAQYLQR